jgi:hypothetical protein
MCPLAPDTPRAPWPGLAHSNSGNALPILENSVEIPLLEAPAHANLSQLTLALAGGPDPCAEGAGTRATGGGRGANGGLHDAGRL